MCPSNLDSDIPAPKMITLERQLIHSVLISWKPPDSAAAIQTIISAYHIYVDGQFRMSVQSKEKTRALLDRVDSDKPHRISIRAICTRGQSKDAECTLVVGRGMTATPGRLRATQIGTKSAKLSWIPGNSNYWHRVYLNQQELYNCPPGVYKVLLTDLPPDTLHRVCVQALPQTTPPITSQSPEPPSWILNTTSGVDTQHLSAFIEFRTLPIGLPDPPTNVQLEPGPQDGMLLVTWTPVPQDKGAAAAASAAGASGTLPVQGYTVCLNERSLMEVDGASNDHAIIPLKVVKEHLDQVFLETQSSAPSTNLDLALDEALSSDLGTFGHPGTTSDLAQTLLITVHSTVPLSAVSEETQHLAVNSCATTAVLKGSAGPGSRQICLTPEILVAAGGSLEATVHVLGVKLAQQLGIDELAARRAGVPLISTAAEVRSPSPTTQNTSNPATSVSGTGTVGPEQGLITVSADTMRKRSPTTDAIGSAEALLMRHRLEESRERAAITSSPEMTWPGYSVDSLRGISTRSRSARSPAPWPWPSGFSGPRVRTPAMANRSPTRTHRGRYSRKSWRQTRSMSDDYEPRLGPPGVFPPDHICPDEEEDNSDNSAWSSEAPFSRYSWLRASSLYNLNHRIPAKRWRPRGAAKSSWDIRSLPNYDEPVGSGYPSRSRYRDEYGRILQPRSANLCDLGAPYDTRPSARSLSAWPDAGSRWAPIYTKLGGPRTQRRFGGKIYREFGSVGPGPIITAFSSSSNDEKRGGPYADSVGPDSARLLSARFSSGDYTGPDGRYRFPPPRSRSTSPHRTSRPSNCSRPLTRELGIRYYDRPSSRWPESPLACQKPPNSNANRNRDRHRGHWPERVGSLTSEFSTFWA
ncbi:unnamed protein product [Echinostoma caproni]|uniref:Fibronectin type-III domain-containing protein n=1 Tax=Echinostoma caproni TaxID=27848 RepID=A0A183AJ04_9TREM|nr:unnamed protein product [Echinostoma caproni]